MATFVIPSDMAVDPRSMDALCRLVEETQREAMEMLAIGAIKDAINIDNNEDMEVDDNLSPVTMKHAKIPQAVSARHLAARGVWKQRQESRLTKEGWGMGQTTQGAAGGSNSNTNIWASPDRRIGGVSSSGSAYTCAPASWSGAPAANSPIQAVSLNVNSFLIPL